jgi:hypothetical protein
VKKQIKNMNIEDLLHKYFEGKTSRKEELQLRKYFTQENIPFERERYRPLFSYFVEESKSSTPSLYIGRHRKKILYTIGSIAACAFLAISIFYQERGFCDYKNYVIIDGQLYTNEYLIREKAQSAFKDVSFDEPDTFNLLFND